jgi:putative transposase
MARVKRCLADGLTYHVINRGNGKQKVFHKNQDFNAFIRLMKEAKKRYPLNIYAYCLMPNHFHLVLMPNQPHHLSKWMHWLMTTHARRYHYFYKTSGYIWQSRFKSFIIQNDEHLITVLRYVEGNPARAKLVLSSKDWLWSSYRERIGKESGKILDPLPIKLPSNWTEYVDKHLTCVESENLRQSVNRQAPFGDIEWQKKTSQQLGLEQTLRSRGRPKKKF